MYICISCLVENKYKYSHKTLSPSHQTVCYDGVKKISFAYFMDLGVQLVYESFLEEIR